MDEPGFGLLVAAAAVIVAMLLVGGWYLLLRRPRDRAAPQRLGQAMDLVKLNEPGDGETVWFGGERDGRAFALTHVNLRYGSYGRRRPALSVEDVILSLELAVALETPGPSDIIAYFHHGRPFRPGEEPPDFEYAFDRRNTERLSQASRDALLSFVQSYGSLRLRDRAGAPAGLFPEKVLSGAQVVLVHARPGHEQAVPEVETLLDALLELAAQLESDPAFCAPV